MQPIKIFCSCAPNSLQDKRYIEDLDKHLAQVQRDGLVQIWHVHKISPGVNVERELHDKLNSADIILIFLSPDYMASDHCINVEAKRAVWLESKGIATVRVLLLRHVYWKNAPFSWCQPLPKNRKFISKWVDKNEAFLDVVRDIHLLIDEAQGNRSVREAIRKNYRPVMNQPHVLTVMPPFEALMKERQTDEIKLERHTDNIRLERRTDEIKSPRRTERLKRRKINTRPKQEGLILADVATPSEFTVRQKLKSLPRARRRVRSTDITNWQNRASKEYNFMSKKKRGIFFFYPMILIDALGLPAAILGWSNSLVLFSLALIISLPCVIIGAVNTGNLIPIPLALLYASVWGIIIHHFRSWSLLDTIGIIVIITFIHLLLFRKNYR